MFIIRVLTNIVIREVRQCLKAVLKSASILIAVLKLHFYVKIDEQISTIGNQWGKKSLAACLLLTIRGVTTIF